MKITIILTVLCLQVYAGSNAQNVSLSLRNASLKETFKQIHQQTGYDFLYNSQMLDRANPVNINVNNVPLTQVLEQCLKSQPLTYAIVDKTIVLKSKPSAPLKAIAIPGIPIVEVAPPIIITGKVTNKNGDPLPGVSILVKGTNKGIITDKDGNYKLTINLSDKILVFSCVGMKKQEITINGQLAINIVMKEEVSAIDEVQIIAYGTTTKRFNTGSVSSINAVELAKTPVTNPLQALEGKVPGLLILENSGTPGGGITVQIRAANSLASTTGSTPLYIVDGVPFVSDALYSAGGNTVGYLKPSFGSNPLNTINPSDIESISILKDADATSLYGSRGANGVILITTKKGQPGKTRFEMNLSTGISTVPNLHRVSTLSLKQYLEIRRAAFANAGVTPTATTAPDLLVWDTTKSTDWQKLLFGGTAHRVDASASFSGGNQQTNFLLSGTYHSEDAVIPGDYKYQRGAFHLSVNHTTLDEKFKASISVDYSIDKNTSSARAFQSADLASIAYALPPNYPLYDSNGDLYWYSKSYTNPLAYTYQRYKATNNNLVGNITLEYIPIKGLDFKLSTGYNRLVLNQENLSYRKSINPYTTDLPYSAFQENYTEAWTVEPTVNYTRNISKGRLNILAGGTWQDNKFVQPFYITASNFTSDALLKFVSAAGSYTAYTSSSEYKYSSAYGRVNYIWDNKYILNLNYRLDASSKFGRNNRLGNFGSIGAAWIFSEEKVIKKALPWLSYAKLRSSYGITGNDQIGNYEYFDTYSISGYQYDNSAGLYPTKVTNPDLKWEENRKLEVAMDLGFLNNRILLNGTWFLNRTVNPLVSYPLPTLTGFASYTANMNAVVQNTGTEFELTTKNIDNKNFKWTTSFNISFPQSKLVSFSDILSTSYINNRVVGNSLSTVYLYKYAGISATTGYPTVVDANNDGVTDYNSQNGLAVYGKGDRVAVGKSDPDFYGGLNNSIEYKRFQLDVFVQFVGKKMVPGIGYYSYSGSVPGYSASNMYSGVYDLFKQTNGKIAGTVFNYVYNNANSPYNPYMLYASSDAILSNAAFVRLKNVSLSYAIPSNWAKHLGLAGGTLYIRAQNIFTITKFEGYDPESQPNNIPPLRTVTIGAQFSF